MCFFLALTKVIVQFGPDYILLKQEETEFGTDLVILWRLEDVLLKQKNGGISHFDGVFNLYGCHELEEGARVIDIGY